jgi:hypothetical protein
MNSFPGQLTRLAFNGTIGGTWTVPTYYLQAFFQVGIASADSIAVDEP